MSAMTGKAFDPTKPDGMKPLLKLSGIGKDYMTVAPGAGRLGTMVNLILGRAVKQHFSAVKDVDLAIYPGESWGIVGENGAGKSTLLKIIANVVKPTAGTKVVNGRVGALLELGTGFHPDYTGRENVYLAAMLMGWTRKEATERMNEILAFADIGEHIEQPVKTYSSGMIVRLGFAVATALQPDLLVTDEVLAVGDESFQKKCLRWMEAYLASGGTLMLCSHSMYHVQRLCQKAIWVHHGRNHMQGTAESVTQAYLAYHEEKNQRAKSEERTHQVSGSYATFQELVVLAADNSVQSHFEMGDEIIVNGIYHSPDGFPTVLMVGVMRIDGTPVFGTFSPSRERYGNRIGPGRYAFRFVLLRNTLLPGKYKIKAHTLDEHGLRLFDSIEADIVIGGKSLDHGLVWLQHDWWPGEDIGAQRELNTSNK